MSELLLEARHVDLCLGGRMVLEDVSLQLEAGHFLGIVGPNGAGKSSLIAVIVGCHRDYRGSLRLLGQEAARLSRKQRRREIGYLHQLHGAQQHLPLRVEDVVAMGLPGWERPLWRSLAQREAIEQALRWVDMWDARALDFRQLSGGQAQRVRLARALVHRPRLLLLDEPSAAMDSAQQQRLYALLRRLCDETGMGVIMVEHDIAAITGYVDSVACLNRRIHYHAMKGEQIPEDVWHRMYGAHMHVIAHDSACIGCRSAED